MDELVERVRSQGASEQQARAYVLRYSFSRVQEEIAIEMGISQPRVCQLLAAAVRHMKSQQYTPRLLTDGRHRRLHAPRDRRGFKPQRAA
jgi:hypothetical protein